MKILEELQDSSTGNSGARSKSFASVVHGARAMKELRREHKRPDFLRAAEIIGRRQGIKGHWVAAADLPT